MTRYKDTRKKVMDTRFYACISEDWPSIRQQECGETTVKNEMHIKKYDVSFEFIEGLIIYCERKHIGSEKLRRK